VKTCFRSWPFWLACAFLILAIGAAVFLHQDQANLMHPALDKLASVSLEERWSHPEMLKIRAMGANAIPPLRRVLREKDKPSTQFLLRLKAKWPGVAKLYPYLPDPNKLTQRRWTACQVLQTLGPIGKPAVPELIQVIASKDPGDPNGGSMALWSVGIDAEACALLDEVLEKGTAGFGRVQIIMALGTVKPPTARTLRALTNALTDTSPLVPNYAADTLGHLGVATPEVVAGLKNLISTSTDDLTTITASTALWELNKDSQSTTGRVFQILEKQLLLPLAPPIGGGSGGQGIDGTEQIFMKGADLFSRVGLAEPEKAKALALLDAFCQKSGRIFIRMNLLSPMLELGFPRDKCIEVCKTGLSQEEVYYRIQAAQLLMAVGIKYPLDAIDLDALLHDQELGVRVYAARAHWHQKKQAKPIVPVLIEALDRNKHQSYYFAEILPIALKTLREIGPEAHDAVEALNSVATDPNPTIANLATEALAKIRQ
jgi:HEAT repeat protein